MLPVVPEDCACALFAASPQDTWISARAVTQIKNTHRSNRLRVGITRWFVFIERLSPLIGMGPEERSRPGQTNSSSSKEEELYPPFLVAESNNSV